MTEIWKPAFEWEDGYEVSSLGRVRSLSRIVPCSKGTRRIRSKVLKPQMHVFGYPTVMVSLKGKTRRLNIHRLMYQSFYGPLPKEVQVRHLNNDPADCRLINLTIGSSADNHKDMVEAGRSTAGERHPGVKLTEDDVQAIRASGRSQQALAALHGVAQSTISKIQRRERWSYIQ